MKKLALASFAFVAFALTSCGEKKVENTETVVTDTIATPADSTMIETPEGDTIAVETPADSTVVETTTETTTTTAPAEAQ